MLVDVQLDKRDEICGWQGLPLGKTIVVGSGPVGMRLVDEILRRQPAARVHLFGNEPFQPYNRVLLSALLAGEKSARAIEIPVPDPGLHPNFEFTVAAIKRIFPAQQYVEDALGGRHYFDHLVLATGARAHVPNIPGNQSRGVYTFRSMKDTEALYSRMASARHVVVVGGGVLGIEAARGLSRLNTQVTLVQQGSRLMNRQLDSEAAQLLTTKVSALGIRVITDSGVREIYAGARVTGVRIYSGEEIECDTVLLSAGIRPNLELAREANLKTATGVVVDDQLQTSHPNIYAVGECSEHRGKTYGLVGPGLEQAAIAAEVLSGGKPVYQGSTTVSRLKVIGEDVVSLGEVVELMDRPRQREVRWGGQKKSSYRKIVVHKGKLIGAVGYGRWPDFSRVQELFQSGRRVWPWQMLWFWLCGRLWFSESAGDVNKWPATAIVCQCNQVCQGELLKAKAQGCTTVASLSGTTRAGTTCGSCKPLLAQLVGARPQRAETWQWLLGGSTLAAALVALVVLMPAESVAQSVQTQHWFEKIWNDKGWKQVTGFSLLGLVAIGMLMSLRKRLQWNWMGSFPGWRLLHVALGVASAVLLVFHTGFHPGENLNRLLLLTFLLVLVMGALAGTVTALGHRLAPGRAQAVQRGWSLLHIVAAWPLPVLLMVHVLSVYYF
ncbi:FAD-dependent oxidoreductase [Pseudomaricurvus alcaniphilus]|uniref:FAD-dependent oxidoreductase n=1 Tax=Pseudomaricurvus alcaniphilus TaxID=1166482 RepID=UPI00140B739B|nr:FAD-dependent oxidoreductase [Pseudomaricurvus alcaniphilus]NHN38160.1 FAD-dependent oxidoreductase [Pseudomaricurvus alcaniphilus]